MVLVVGTGFFDLHPLSRYVTNATCGNPEGSAYNGHFECTCYQPQQTTEKPWNFKSYLVTYGSKETKRCYQCVHTGNVGLEDPFVV